MNLELIGHLVRLRYKLMWARTRTRNGKIALFVCGYVLLIFLLILVAAGGLGAGIVAVRSGKGELPLQGILSGLYLNAVLASVLLGFGINTVFADVELRRYPLKARERSAARHVIGMADPFWLLYVVLELALVFGVYLLGASAVWLGTAAVLLLFVTNYLLAQVVAMAAARLVAKRGGSTMLLGAFMALCILPGVLTPMFRHHPDRVAAVMPVLRMTPPFAAAAGTMHSGMAALYGLGLLTFWCIGLAALVLALDRHAPRRHVAQAGPIRWESFCDRVAAIWRPEYRPLITHWLRFYLRNNRFRVTYPLALLMAGFLIYGFGRSAGPRAQLAGVVSAFAMLGCFGTMQFAVNQFGHLGEGLRRFFMLPVRPDMVLRSGSYVYLLMMSPVVTVGTLLFAVLAPVPYDAHLLAGLVAVALAGMFFIHGVGLWTTLLAPRRGNYYASMGNDLSLVGNIVMMGWVMGVMLVPRVVARAYPGAMALLPGYWWAALVLAMLSAAFYFASLRAAGTMLAARKERLLAVVEGRG